MSSTGSARQDVSGSTGRVRPTSGIRNVQCVGTSELGGPGQPGHKRQGPTQKAMAKDRMVVLRRIKPKGW